MSDEVKDVLWVKEGIISDLKTGSLTDDEGGNIDISSSLTFAEAKNMTFGTSTGTKIGGGATQKLAFYGDTPIVQAVLSTAASNSDIVTALQNLGLVRQS